MKTAGANGANCQRRGRSAVDEEAKQQTHLDGIGIFWVGLEIKLLFFGGAANDNFIGPQKRILPPLALTQGSSPKAFCV